MDFITPMTRVYQCPHCGLHMKAEATGSGLLYCPNRVVVCDFTARWDDPRWQEMRDHYTDEDGCTESRPLWVWIDADAWEEESETITEWY